MCKPARAKHHLVVPVASIADKHRSAECRLPLIAVFVGLIKVFKIELGDAMTEAVDRL